ncbi:hypothetical protein EVAR_94826_1 [Eumeta japonica]|uniref:Uncharacterized protein n=1 Tax=Eumeta variegata TaxID=151549 RepID=A0A4C1UIN9_EUMVA|nr:hypothetical protein EVAR_94826_1 [Eumeta japonica]
MSHTAFESQQETFFQHFAASTKTSEFSRVGQIMSLYHGPRSTDVVFGRPRRRTSLTQIVSQISATTFELVKIPFDCEWRLLSRYAASTQTPTVVGAPKRRTSTERLLSYEHGKLSNQPASEVTIWSDFYRVKRFAVAPGPASSTN